MVVVPAFVVVVVAEGVPVVVVVVADVAVAVEAVVVVVVVVASQVFNSNEKLNLPSFRWHSREISRSCW